MPAIERLIIDRLVATGFRHDPAAATLLLIDAPQGFALRQLELLDPGRLCVIVTTNNFCPEYLEDLWDLQPAILLAGDNLRGEVDQAIERIATGERYRIVPHAPVRLTPTERVLLQFLARGWTVERIAQQRGVSPKTVNNALATICAKLNMPTRRAAMLYYWGRLDLLD